MSYATYARALVAAAYCGTVLAHPAPMLFAAAGTAAVWSLVRDVRAALQHVSTVTGE